MNMPYNIFCGLFRNVMPYLDFKLSAKGLSFLVLFACWVFGTELSIFH